MPFNIQWSPKSAIARLNISRDTLPRPIWVTFLQLGLDLRPVLGCHTPGPDVRGHLTRQFSAFQYSMESQRCYCASKHKPGYAAPLPIWVTFLWLGLDLRLVFGCHTPGRDVRGQFTRQFRVLQYSMESQRCYCASKHKPGYAAPLPIWATSL